jgi:non-canonical purine NTP pyrophosphatase (RdgB/HAM1 family)
MLDARGQETSTARFVCALALADGHDILFEAQGTVEGQITRQPRGAHGFGYDPVFYYPPFGKTLAEVGAADKARVSHRGHAFAQLREFLARPPLLARASARHGAKKPVPAGARSCKNRREET